jgi:erythromycin esterase
MPPVAAIRTLPALVLWARSFQLHALPGAQQDPSGADALAVWARSAATPLAPLDAPDDPKSPAELSRLAGLTRATRVLALGESVHGTPELTAQRARLTEELIARGRVSAVVMETGLAEARAIDAWIGHETDVAPDFDRSLSYGFGKNRETIDALRWIREHNARVGPARRVRFYGMDQPANGGGSLLPALEPVWSFLDDADPHAAAESRAVVKPLGELIASESYGIVGKYAALGAPQRDTLRAQLDSLVASLRANERTYVARTSPERYAWALRLAQVAAQTEANVRIGWNDASNPRDVGMAENVRWVVRREAARGLVVVWAHDLHVGRVPITGPMFASRGGAAAVASMGQLLARSLGPAYLPVGSAFRRRAADSAGVVDSTTVDAALARVGEPRFLLDLSRAPRVGPVARWLGEARLKRAEDGYVVTTMSRAFDAVVYVDSLGS